MKKASWLDRLKYFFDNCFSKGPVFLIPGLAVVSVIMVLSVAVILVAMNVGPKDNADPGFIEIFWLSLLRTLDPGTMGDDQGWIFRIAMLLVTLGGILVLSLLIGILTAAIEGRIETLRKGRSLVVENGHTVILGWSLQIFTVISELVVANENQRRPCIAVLAARDKVEMEDAIAERLPTTKNTRVVCRTGSLIDQADLEIVNVDTARSIIILAPDVDDPDPQVIKTVLAITNHPDRRKEPYHIVAPIVDPENAEIVKMVGKDEVEVVLARDIISRIAAQTCRQSGLSVVYTELMDFAGDEIYFQEEPRLVGKTFKEALMAYEDSAVLGILPASGDILVNAPMDTVIQEGDKIIAVSEDDDTVVLSDVSEPRIERDAITPASEKHCAAESTLILGWNGSLPLILREIDKYVSEGSKTRVIANVRGIETAVSGVAEDLVNMTVTASELDSTNRSVLSAAEAETYNHIMVMSYCDLLPPQEADACTLVTLLHLRDIAEGMGKQFSIVSEMLLNQNRRLAEVTQANDFIVSEHLVSLMLAQLSENKKLADVFDYLFDAKGSEIYMRPVSRYVQTGTEVTFYTIIEAAQRYAETAIGYRLASESADSGLAYGVTVNPPKSKLISFAQEDSIIVLAED